MGYRPRLIQLMLPSFHKVRTSNWSSNGSSAPATNRGPHPKQAISLTK